MSGTGRNDPCPCGSGRKYGKCCLVDNAVAAPVYEQHYGRWVDEPVPALGGRTPPEAARLPRVPPKLVALLQEFENRAARQRQEGRPAYDFAWKWGELRLRVVRGVWLDRGARPRQ